MEIKFQYGSHLDNYEKLKKKKNPIDWLTLGFKPGIYQVRIRYGMLTMNHFTWYIRGTRILKNQDRLNWLLPEGSAGCLVVSKALIPQP